MIAGMLLVIFQIFNQSSRLSIQKVVALNCCMHCKKNKYQYQYLNILKSQYI